MSLGVLRILFAHGLTVRCCAASGGFRIGGRGRRRARCVRNGAAMDADNQTGDPGAASVMLLLQKTRR
jgi:hypothetical protein